MASHIRLALRGSDRAAMCGSLRRARPDRCGTAVRSRTAGSSHAADGDTAAAPSPDAPPSHPNYFTLLQVPQAFGIDEARLKENYRGLMRRHHPDKRRSEDGAGVGGAGPEAPPASLVTRAYDTLRRPHLRAQHLLALETGLAMEDEHQERERRRRHREQAHAQQVEEEDGPSSSAHRAEELVGVETLMEVLELREAIDAEASEEGLRQLLEENRQRMEATGRELEHAFGDKDFDRALRLTAKLQYWNRIHETIREKLPH